MEFLDSSSSSSDLSDYEVSNGESTEAMLALNLPHTLSRPHICHFFSTNNISDINDKYEAASCQAGEQISELRAEKSIHYFIIMSDLLIVIYSSSSSPTQQHQTGAQISEL